MSKRTPGPWQQNGSHVYGPDPERRLICQLHYDGNPEDDGNAALIVGASDLLEELRNAARAMRTLAEMVLGQNHTHRPEAIRLAERYEAAADRVEAKR
jgi:hypothetical protein